MPEIIRVPVGELDVLALTTAELGFPILAFAEALLGLRDDLRFRHHAIQP